METVVVPVDFSTPSLNAAQYAVDMLAGSYGSRLILYHMYEKEHDQEVAEDQLRNLQTALSKNTPIRIETVGVCGDDFLHEIERVVHHRNASLLVMGITGKTMLEQVFVGSNTLKVIDKKIAPVLIVPPSAQFNQIKNVALASDFKDVRLTTPSVPIKSVLDLFRPALHIVNVDSEHYVSLTPEYQEERAIMAEMFDGYNPEFYFIGMNDFFDAIEKFIEDKHIDMLITIPRQHSFLKSILSENHTKKLAYHSYIPLLAVHE